MGGLVFFSSQSLVKQGKLFDKATLNSLMTSSLPRYLNFIDARVENPVSHKYVVAIASWD
jgi:hypothetical protein